MSRSQDLFDFSFKKDISLGKPANAQSHSVRVLISLLFFREED